MSWFAFVYEQVSNEQCYIETVKGIKKLQTKKESYRYLLNKKQRTRLMMKQAIMSEIMR